MEMENPMSEIEQALWTDIKDEDSWYDRHLIEQYKLYVEMADRISQRRGSTNTFFLTFNTTVVAALAGFYESVPSYISIVIYLAATIMAIAWAIFLKSYRNISSAKFKVIGALEKKLPAQLYYAAEWKALGEGKDFRKYVPLSIIETIVPLIFFMIYLYLFMQSI